MHPVIRDQVLLGYAPEGDEYEISDIVVATPAHQAGHRVGAAIARDVIADEMPRQWTGLDPQDADQLAIVGIEPSTPEWDQAEFAARAAFFMEISK